MAKFNLDKVKAQLSGLDADELYQAYNEIKAYIQNRLTEEQALVENRANELQQRIYNLNGNY